jgi:hypothetical protein
MVPSLRSGDAVPRTCAVSPTFRCGAFFFVALALADVPSASLTLLHASLAAMTGETKIVEIKENTLKGFGIILPEWQQT